MACEYYSRIEAAIFDNEKTLARALERCKAQGRRDYQVNGLTVTHTSQGAMNELRQAYSLEASKAALKAKGYFVAEKRDLQTGKIRLTVTA